MNILVTGAAGYIGSVLCQQLVQWGHRVVGVDILKYQNAFAVQHLLGVHGFEFHRQDVRDTERLWQDHGKHADCIIPLAALVGAPLCENQPREAEEVNTQAVLSLLQRCSPHQRIVYPNSNSGYGQTDGIREVTEEDPLAPISLYGKTKCLAEESILDHPLGVSLRLATVFGISPRMRFDLLVNDFVAQLLHAEKLRKNCSIDSFLTVFEPHFKRNFIGVQDVGRVFTWMVHDHRETGVFNVGLPNGNLSKMELAYKVAGTLGLFPMDYVKVGNGNDPDGRNYLVSNEKLLKTGFRFTQMLNDGIKQVGQLASLLDWSTIKGMRNA